MFQPLASNPHLTPFQPFSVSQKDHGEDKNLGWRSNGFEIFLGCLNGNSDCMQGRGTDSKKEKGWHIRTYMFQYGTKKGMLV